MTLEQNKAIARRYIELFNEGNLTGLDEVVASDVVDHYRALGIAPGLEGLKQTLTGIRSAFPDMYVAIEDIIAEGDRVVIRASARGTHKGLFMGTPPTGKQFVMHPVVAIYRISGGKITDRWNVSDTVDIMQQLGVISAAA